MGRRYDPTMATAATAYEEPAQSVPWQGPGEPTFDISNVDENVITAAFYVGMEHASFAKAAQLLAVDEALVRRVFAVRYSFSKPLTRPALLARVRARARELEHDYQEPADAPDETTSAFMDDPEKVRLLVDSARRLCTSRQAAVAAGVSHEALVDALARGKTHLREGRHRTPEARLRRAWDEVRVDQVTSRTQKLIHLSDHADSEAVQLAATTKILETFDKRFEPRSRKDVNVKVSGGVRVEKLSLVGQLPVGELASLLAQMRIGGGDGLGNVLDVSAEDRPDMIEAASEDSDEG